MKTTLRYRAWALAALLGFGFGLGAPADGQADTPAGGLGGLAVHPRGDTIVAAGDTRALYIIDAESGEVRQRHWTGTTVVWMDYRLDGGALIMRDTSDMLQVLDATTLDVVWSQEKAVTAAYAPAANWLAFVSGSRKERTLTVIDATSFETVSTIELGELRPIAMGISADGLFATILERSDKRETEEKTRAGNDVKGIAKTTFNQQHDQRGARILQANLITGALSTVDSWYKSDNVRALKVGPTHSYVLSASNEMAAIDRNGEVEILDSGASNHYGATMSPTLDKIISGSLASITIKALGADAAQKLKLDRLPGWPEYVIRFDTAPNGKIYGSTTAYRLIELDPSTGKMRTFTIH